MPQRIDNLSALDWDDSALIKAYNKGMTLKGENFEKETNTAKENYKKSSKKKQEWKVGDHCRAIYDDDNLWYEAKIVAIRGDMCYVEFLGYEEEGEVRLNSLDKSLGKKAIKKQIKNAKKVMRSDADESASGGDEPRIDQSEIESPHPYEYPRRYEYHPRSRRGDRRNHESYMFNESNFTAGESNFHNDYPLMKYPDMSITVPPPPVPPCTDLGKNPTSYAVLTSWYMAGYYTGLNQGQKNSSQQRCCCHQTFNCHH